MLLTASICMKRCSGRSPLLVSNAPQRRALHHLRKRSKRRKRPSAANHFTELIGHRAVASGWVSPGAATQAVTSIFSFKNWRSFLLITVNHTGTFIDFSRVSPPPLKGVTPNLFTSRLSTILCKFALKTFFPFGCHPRGGCHPGRSPRFPSDARGKL